MLSVGSVNNFNIDFSWSTVTGGQPLFDRLILCILVYLK